MPPHEVGHLTFMMPFEQVLPNSIPAGIKSIQCNPDVVPALFISIPFGVLQSVAIGVWSASPPLLATLIGSAILGTAYSVDVSQRLGRGSARCKSKEVR